jgi:protein-tyrosine phosphatase
VAAPWSARHTGGVAPFPQRSLDGGIDEIPLVRAAPAGRLFLCGKHVVGPDPHAALARAGASTVVCLNEEDELVDRYPGYVAWLRTERERRAVWFPIPDLHAPPVVAMERLLDELLGRLHAGEHLLVHCGAGIGRAGTTAVGVLLRLGWDLDDALVHVRRHRPLAGPEAGEQLRLVYELAGRGQEARRL